MSERNYRPAEVEAKWQQFWDENGTNEPDLVNAENPYYLLMMFPYPSAEGLHVGNVYAFTAADIQGRYHRLRGCDVFEPMGFDAFGIHSENYAMKVGRHPNELIPSNTKNFTRQLKMMGLMLDWSHKVDSTAPDYYRWTQWVFLQLYKMGLAVRKEAPVTWCPECKTVVSDEFVDADGCCDRHPGAKVEKRTMTQWFFRITEYAQQLLDNLDWIDWSDSTRKMQIDWIGRSEGAEVDFAVEGSDETIRVFTTRPDTLFGATYMVLAPEHPLVDALTADDKKDPVEGYRELTAGKSEIDRAADSKEKTGVDIGARAINPMTGESIPIFISDYVMMGYGTGAIMAVPAHDVRDFAFAKAFGLEIRCILDPDVAAGDGDSIADLENDRKALLTTKEGQTQIRELVLAGEECWAGPGRAINSSNDSLDINGLAVADAKRAATEWVAARGLGEAKINFRLRDWCISRQRYWGPPIPMIHCPACGVVPVPEADLPVELPEIDNFQPIGSGQSPLAACEEWVNVACPVCGAPAKRETDVSDNFLDSAWYFLRYPCANDATQAFSTELMDKWLPVDFYIGGNEHARLHLLYTRFITMALCDGAGLKMGSKADGRDPREPFLKFRAHGMITNEGSKMSKSRGTVVNPDEMVEKFGADSLRMYLMFLGPIAQGGDWQGRGISGVSRFLDRVHRFYFEEVTESAGDLDAATLTKLHQTIKKVTEDVEGLCYNTAIAALMELLNALRSSSAVDDFAREAFCTMLAPFAPHLTEEIWSEALGKAPSVADASWPVFDEALCVEDSVEIAVQINGKVRDRLTIARDADEATVKEIALAADGVQSYLEGKSVIKFIHVPNRLANVIVK